jgi:hypothetical protein
MTASFDEQNGAMDINGRVLGMPVSLSPLHESIREFKRAVLKVDSELKVSICSDCYTDPSLQLFLCFTFPLGVRD